MPGSTFARAKVSDDADPCASTPILLVALATPGDSPSPIKIGKITKYETKAYVGDAKIIDIERSSSADGPKGD